MPLWGKSTSKESKPKYLNAEQAAATFADKRGWVYKHPNGTEEVLVTISGLNTLLAEPNLTSVYFANTKAQYTQGNANSFVLVSFNEKVTVTGTPTMVVSSTNQSNVTSNTVATYTSGTGTNELLFKFTVPATANSVLSIPTQTVVTGASNNIVDVVSSANAIVTISANNILAVQGKGKVSTINVA